MSPPIDRREFIRGSAALGALAALGGLSACGESPNRPDDAVPVVDFLPPQNWDYPAVVELLPFGHGVASGDPLADRVILWTRVTVPDARGWEVADPQGLQEVTVDWLAARDPALNEVVRRGRVRTGPELDWTVKVDAAGLEPASTYYYAFHALGRSSVIGRTRTAPGPGQDVAELRIAQVACASYFSTDFHAYGRIAERDDLDLVCHAGDHVYDSVDDQQWYRARNGIYDENYVDFRDWRRRAECGRRYALYFSDPDLFRARQNHPFAVIGDNHDWSGASDPDTGIEFSSAEAAEVFWLWTASRPPRADGSGEFDPPPLPDAQVPAPRAAAALLQYRYLPYGRMGEVLLIDMRWQREPEAATPLARLLGSRQAEWLQRVVLASAQERQARHRVIVNGVNMSQLALFALPLPQLVEALGLNANGPELYPGWGEVEGAREEFYGFLRATGIVDNLVMSGDSHGWFCYDLIETAGLGAYNPLNGGGVLGTVGVEIVPSAIGRANGQEAIAGALYELAHGQPPKADYQNFQQRWVPAALPLTRLVEQAAELVNPNLRYFNWHSYGYGLAHLDAGGLTSELWQVPYPQRSVAQALLRQFRSPLGAPHLAPVLRPEATAGGRLAPAPGPVALAPWR